MKSDFKNAEPGGSPEPCQTKLTIETRNRTGFCVVTPPKRFFGISTRREDWQSRKQISC